METANHTTQVNADQQNPDSDSNKRKFSQTAVVMYTTVSTCLLIIAALYCYFTDHLDAALMLAVPAIIVPIIGIKLYKDPLEG